MDLGPFLRMLLAAGLVVPIGLERELRGKAAGLRTHVVVGTASAALGYVSLLAAPESSSVADQTRIAAQVVSGIGFIGAGVIFAARGRVHGLTTAASLWSASAVGLCVGLGQASLALATVVVTLLFLWPVDFAYDRWLGGFSKSERAFQIVARDLSQVQRVQEALAAEGLRAMEFTLKPFGDGVTVGLTVRCQDREAHNLVDRLKSDPALGFVSDQAIADTDG